ncbi:hypothetical protein [Flavobacterium fluviatile]|uniref:hypothetical protein n=1 Tax=Flavobacterium fluviatile TaxID=1862387 RepID=UPI0013D04429|nr:hypothetical protein [Flavobacterium fluviatile]
MKQSINSKTKPKSLVASVSVSVTDLHIGNMITRNFGGVKIPVIIECVQDLMVIEQNPNDFEYCVPTWNILKNFGFVYNTKESKFYHKEYEFVWVDMNNPICIKYGNKSGTILIFDYVHQLQNIFSLLNSSNLQIVSLTEH